MPLKITPTGVKIMNSSQFRPEMDFQTVNFHAFDAGA